MSDYLWKTEITHKAGNTHVAKLDHEEEMPQIANTDLLTQPSTPDSRTDASNTSEEEEEDMECYECGYSSVT